MNPFFFFALFSLVYNEEEFTTDLLASSRAYPRSNSLMQTTLTREKILVILLCILLSSAIDGVAASVCWCMATKASTWYSIEPYFVGLVVGLIVNTFLMHREVRGDCRLSPSDVMYYVLPHLFIVVIGMNIGWIYYMHSAFRN